MMRRTNRWIAVGCTLLGLAGWQTFGGSASLACPAGDGGQVSREAEQQPQSDVVQADDGTGDATHTSKVRQAEHIRPSAGDPFAPITVDEILTASSERPVSSLPTSGEASPAGYLAPPVPIGETHGSLAATHPVPLAEAVMPGMSPMLGGPAGAMIPGGSMAVALDGGCGACGRTVGGPCGELYSGLINNMVVIAAFDYFTNTGDLQSERLRRAATQLNIGPVEIPDLDPQRIAGLFGANAGAPITRGGRICYQVGFNYNQAEQGAHGFFTTGIFHRAGPGDCWPINWGSVYDFMYDDFLGYHAGQVRLKMGYLFGECDEVGGWVAISTNTDEEEATIRTQTLDPQGNRVGPVFDDTIQSRVTVTQAAYLLSLIHI